MTERETASWFVYVIRLADDLTAADRDAVIVELREAGIGCSNYFAPVHTQPYIMAALGTNPGDLPVTEGLANRTIALPFFANLTQEHVSAVHKGLVRAIDGRLADC